MENLKRRALFREQLEKDSQEQEDEEGTEKSFVEGEDSEETAADDNELWDQDEVLVQVQVGAKRHDNRLKVLRRSFSEVTIAFGVHLAFLVYCTAVNVTDATVFKKCVDPDRVFVGHNTFGGRFKYLTHLFMVRSRVTHVMHVICFVVGFSGVLFLSFFHQHNALVRL